MSWLARSIANSLKLDDDEYDVKPSDKPESKPDNSEDDDSSPNSPSRGVKEDLSELSKTLTRQFWGVASFLAPPPQSEPRSESEKVESDPDYVPGIRTDFAEIGGKFKSEISRLSNNINVSEITKIASSFLQLESDDEDEEVRKEKRVGGAVGVTEEVVDFVRDITMHPGTWLDFPLPENIEDYDDFDLSNAQQEHALAVERLVPRLAALRIELCPEYINEACFWKIYFVLLHPRLDKQDAELLSTPQILEARTFLGQELKNRVTIEQEDLEQKSVDLDEKATIRHEEPLSVPSPVISQGENKKTSDVEISTTREGVASEAASPPVESSAIQTVEKPAAEGKHIGQVKSQNVVVEKDGDDADDWLKEEDSEVGAVSGTTIPIENEDDVSFSDLEEDDGDVPVNYRKSNFSSDKDSQDWVQLGKSSSDIDDIDVS